MQVFRFTPRSVLPRFTLLVCGGKGPVMELMDQTLADYLANSRGPLPLSKQVHICLQIAQGLTYLHEHTPQILHRDLTAKNVLVKEDGSIVKIGDLGQAIDYLNYAT